ncbi:vesicle coat protein [Stachybotrys elegans]|uniref:Vesicle coat protein n=1 Tax=Stachybotrys elegans TaxID=80388 RepID=A0A8K0SW92_9HYPO|nr:vesicle coat protein [Stachybotrys elegans]
MGKPFRLITGLQLCLAHYCDTHGPTPLMVTEGLPASCSTCFDETSVIDGRRRATAAPPRSQPQSPVAITEGLRDLSFAHSVSASDPDDLSHGPRPSLLRAPGVAPVMPPVPLETPPDSPRPMFQQPRRDSSYRRTYDETVTKKQGPCDNCAMTLPKLQSGSAGSVDTQTNSTRGPTLRTRAPAERVFGYGGQASPPASQTSSDTDSEHDGPRRPRNRRVESSISSRDRSISSNSTSSEHPPFHIHYVDYTSTHEPVVPNSFSLLRASCLRALSFETLPRAPATTSPTTSPLTTSPPSFVTTQSAGSAVTGGPIFFGDALAGYTTAYIFRIPDVHARGHKRVYAFLALSTHKERLAMKTFAVVSAAFRDLANWIQQLVEAEADRAAAASPLTSLHSSSGYSKPQQSAFDVAATDRSGSSFLTGGSGFTRRMGGAAGASAPKARGLAELVGQPDFFIELHKRFVHLLFEVGVTINS